MKYKQKEIKNLFSSGSSMGETVENYRKTLCDSKNLFTPGCAKLFGYAHTPVDGFFLKFSAQEIHTQFTAYC